MYGIFWNRQEAGRRLAEALLKRGYRGDLLVLGIPGGGVPVAAEVARALHAPLDMLISRKLRAPFQPELAIGAITSGDHFVVMNREVAHALGATPEYLELEISHQRVEIERRLRAFRGDRPLPDVRGRTVVVIDDGIATGYTFRAALEGVRRQQPARLVAAVPVAARESLASVRELADEVVCLETPEPFLAVGMWYDDFSQASDADVTALLREHWARENIPDGERAHAPGSPLASRKAA